MKKESMANLITRNEELLRSQEKLRNENLELRIANESLKNWVGILGKVITVLIEDRESK